MKKFATTVSTYVRNHPKVDLLILGVALAAFLAITLVNAPRASIWFDEAFSAYIAQFSFWDIARYTAADVHPPFYYWLLKVWSWFFGTTELAYRSLSIAFGAGAVTAAFFLTRKLFGRKVAWLALLFMVLSPMLIRYSDEARMYTLTALIAMLATHFMLKAEETKKRSAWIWYGVFISLGMWTHYFMALVWVAHWVWRGTQVWRRGIKAKEFWKSLFSKEWVKTYLIAIGLFLPWLPFMAMQLGIVQGNGFWIGPVGIDTPANYLANYFYYLEHTQVQGWLALIFLIVVTILATAVPRVYRSLNTKEKRSFLLVTALAWAPPMLLFLASLPPLRSSFVERYLIPSLLVLSIFIAVVLIKGTQKWKPFWRAVPILLIVGMMIFGITNVYKYGNFNKNTNMRIMAREAVEAAQAASPVGTPIVVESPWLFYEAIPYSTDEYPIYFIEENTEYIYGSLDMLKYNDQHKIKDLNAFEKEHPLIWYLGTTDNPDVAPYESDWKKIETVSVKDTITDRVYFKATAYKVSEE